MWRGITLTPLMVHLVRITEPSLVTYKEGFCDAEQLMDGVKWTTLIIVMALPVYACVATGLHSCTKLTILMIKFDTFDKSQKFPFAASSLYSSEPLQCYEPLRVYNAVDT